MKDPLRIIEMGKLKDFEEAFENPQDFITDTFEDTIGIFKGSLLDRKSVV